MKVFVTGGTGFIGHNLVHHLVSAGHEVGITASPKENNVKCHAKYSRSLVVADKAVNQYHDVLFHLAAENTPQDADESKMFGINVEKSIALFSKFADVGCKQFVYASSCAVYGKSPAPFHEESTSLSPLTPYARSKAKFEELATKFALDRNVNVVGLRFSNVYGPGENHKGKSASMVTQLYTTLAQGGRPRLFWDGSQRRDWVYVDDVVKATSAAATYSGSGIFNVGFGKSRSFLDVIAVAGRIADVGSVRPQFVAHPYRDTYQDNTECCIDLAAQELGYSPKYDLVSGMEELVRRWR